MSDGLPSIGGESAKFLSDGLTLFLENGRNVCPRVREPDSRQPWVVTWVDPENGEVGLGPEADDTRVVLYLSPATAVFDDDGERIWHYEWKGSHYCDRENGVFDWETGDVECPYCGDEFHVEPPDDDRADLAERARDIREADAEDLTPLDELGE